MILLTGAEVAEITRVKPRTIHLWVQTGQLHVTKVGRLNRFLLRDIERFLGVPAGTLRPPLAGLPAPEVRPMSQRPATEAEG